MKRFTFSHALLAVALLTQTTAALAKSAPEHKLSLYDRQLALMAKINGAERNKELTAKEAKGLRKMLADVSRAKAKMKAKAPDHEHLTKENAAELESQLNDVSTKITSLQLAKRVDKK